MKVYNLEVARQHKTEVTELYLHGLGLAEWPDWLLELPKLQMLGLSQNRLKVVPDEIASLKKLRVLDLSGNAISVLPRSLSKLSSLTEVNLSGNLLSRFPLVLGKLPALQKLDLSANKLGTLPRQFPPAPQLRVLCVGKNRIRELPADWELPVHMRELQLDQNHFSSLPNWVWKLPKLEVLSLGQNRLSEFPISSGQLTTLEWLDLRRNTLTQLPETIGKLRSLRRLLLDHNQISSLPLSLEKLQGLRQFSCQNNQLTEWPLQLSQLPRLEYLGLGHNQLERLPEALGPWPALQELDIQSNCLAELPHTLPVLPRLKTLRLARNHFSCFPGILVTSSNLEVVSGVPGASRALRFIQACQRLEMPYKSRLKLFRIWNGDIAPEKVGREHLFEGLRLSLPSLQKTIRTHFFGQLFSPVEPSGSVIGFLGRSRLSKKEWKENLNAAQIEVAEPRGKTPTHVVLGAGKLEVPARWRKGTISFLEESTLFQQFQDLNKAYLQKREDQGQLGRLLQSKQEASLRLALSLLKNGGVPRTAMTDLFLAWKNLANPSLKKAFRDLLFLHASPAGRRFLENGSSIRTAEKLREACEDTEFDADCIWSSLSNL